MQNRIASRRAVMRMRIRPVACLVWIVLSSAQTQEPKKPAGTSVLRLEAPRVFEQSITHDLRLSERRGEIELAVGELYEDDGPASGRSYQKPENRETVTTQTWIKKELLIPNPQAWAAYLVVLSDVPVEALINGIAQNLGPNQSGRPLHQRYAFDPNSLRAGRNEIILRTSGRVTIARDDEFALGSRTRTRHPGRSAKSTDRGKTWDYGHLGPDGKIEGEYGVRVFLDHYHSQGSLTLPVLDAGNLEGSAVGTPITQTGPIEIAVEGETGPAGSILVRARTGDTYVPAEKHWSDWKELGETGGVLLSPRGPWSFPHAIRCIARGCGVFAWKPSPLARRTGRLGSAFWMSTTRRSSALLFRSSTSPWTILASCSYAKSTSWMRWCKACITSSS
jgi:hypothetical protein